ncbi:G-type lectin S-receptor-like serine/threonine-protein kinase SD2-5 isoform X2 [Malania oleifera]|uniref:G-type lectin S-receptor-like serine/threonine-protein kinase SD2-5 isoform X2 n=1 Tax=Malania oleifera TaxID=397392 RepID=UPI0025AE27CC|nr:G-type lectin S-receptor-like serine/threonine-protein kinase SD2-5 isoform X2 [Malania oleifera]
MFSFKSSDIHWLIKYLHLLLPSFSKVLANSCCAMGPWGFFLFMGYMCLFIVFLSDCLASIQIIGRIYPGLQGSQMNWIDNNGLFLLSNNSNFGFGFAPTQDATFYLLVIVHMDRSTVVWSANRGSPVQNSDMFVFNKSGNAFLEMGGRIVWSTDTSGKGVSAMELQDSGNLVLIGNDSSIIWQSFKHPTNTLLSNQEFAEGMKLVSDPNPNNFSYFLEIKSGDMILYVDFETPQPYWSMGKENRKIINQQDESNPNATWVAVLGTDGFLSFSDLQMGGSSVSSQTKIPNDPCSTPLPCDVYYVCSSNNMCQCPSVLNSISSCNPGIVSPCNQSKGSTELVNAGQGLNYFALGFVPPTSRTDLSGCKASCLENCSCIALFFEIGSGNCFLFDRIGSLQISEKGTGVASYIKIMSNGSNGETQHGSSQNRFAFVVIIAISTVLVIIGLLYIGFRYYQKRHELPESPHENSEEDNFLQNLSGMPIRFSYADLQTATNNFSVKLGQGGFGSVYEGVLPDGTQLAVKKLEGIGQGKKEFRAEVSIIGSIHHLHLVRLKGFCAEGTHRLLAYEYMAKGSLDKWIFKKHSDDFLLDWDIRFNIALGTAKGLAYLHEDCDSKIVHCDIKPENVLLDDNFLSKVSDFGLAKLMTREQSHVFTTLRGTRGYLAPEWITNYAISEKSDVYSYGMLLLEIIGGRKNFDPTEGSEKAHFPSYAFKMLEEGKLRTILDLKLNVDESDERVSTAIRAALWCIQEDMHVRPSMTKVVQMLEGLCDVPQPPTSSQLGSRLYSNFFKSISEGGTSSGPSDCNSDTHISAMRLSGPR